MSEEQRAFEAEVGRFKAWADVYPLAWEYGEWETNYDGWGRIYEAFASFIAAVPCSEWDDETTKLVLYAIARDNEMEQMAADLAAHADQLLCLAERSMMLGEWDARFQIANALGTLESLSPQSESSLFRLAHDGNEYVRRRALLALARLNSPRVADLVGLAWDTGEEYQRIAVLCALDRIDSPQLAHYARPAEEDGRQSLAMYATYIRVNGTLRGFTVQGIPVIY